MEAKLGMLEKRELAWREEKREALAELDLAKERMREEVMQQLKDKLKDSPILCTS